ncbi:MAG: SH3 domain-containing protein [Coriobacteriia bacterium]|nr:SH3 domain-containing protein [Coriobacteriia bacterium]
MSGVGRIARAALGVVVLLALVFLVNGWWSDYRRGEAPVVPVAETTPTPDGAAAEDSAAPPAESADEPPVVTSATVVVLIEGLNFRKEPSREGGLIRGLGRGTRLQHLGTSDGWHHVRDDNGVEGYVSASPQYTEVQQ